MMARRHVGLLLAALLGVASPVATTAALAQTASQPGAQQIDAAKTLIAVVFPASRREEVVGQMLQALTGTMAGGIVQSPGIKEAIDKNPEVKTIIQTFLEQRQVASKALMTAEMPAMVTAIERAYARRFTVAQMAELTRFFSTPTGKVYIEKSQTIMSDPDVVAWQQKLMSRTMNDAKRDLPLFQRN